MWPLIEPNEDNWLMCISRAKNCDHTWLVLSAQISFCKLRNRGHRRKQEDGVTEMMRGTLELVTYCTLCLTRLWVSEESRCINALEEIRGEGLFVPQGGMRAFGFLLPGSHDTCCLPDLWVPLPFNLTHFEQFVLFAAKRA